MTIILDGKKLRDKILDELKKELDKTAEKPSLAVILVGDDAASQIYVNNKKKTAEKIGIKSEIINFPTDIPEETLLKKIAKLNADGDIDAILVQLPLPEHINEQRVVSAIAPKKDVDGFTPENFGKLLSGTTPYVFPCTPKGILLLLDEYKIDIEGKHVVIIGRSNIVGKPLSQLLLRRNATVTVCHSHTKNLADMTKTADILISAVGKKIVKREMIKDNSVVIDVGIFKDVERACRITGDVDFENVREVTSHITPVPGGIGPMTIASLMLNTFELFKLNQKLSK